VREERFVGEMERGGNGKSELGEEVEKNCETVGA
jgi:hypothetical protein